MSSHTIKIEFKINYPVILLVILVLHVIGLMVRGFMGASSTADVMKLMQPRQPEREPLQIRSLTKADLERIRTVGAKESKVKDGVYLAKTKSETKHVTKDFFSPNTFEGHSRKEAAPHKSLSLSDLAMGTKQQLQPPKQASAPTPPVQKPIRPGSRPEVLPEKTKAISAINLRGEEIKQFMRDTNSSGGPTLAGGDAATLSGDPRAQSLNNSDVMVNLEVPEGVDPDELNKYELMFYGFQRRTAMGYVNSFYKHLDKFMAENPHMQFPMTDTKQVMTGRLTYDRDGNIKQIKMVRWSNIDKLQGFFENVLKDMDTLHNPPQALWDKTGDFSIFFSLVING
jgi:hypothetical protein